MEGQQLTAVKYQEIEKLIPTHVQEIRTVFKDKHNLDIPVQCDDFIERCLRQKDGNVDKAIALIQAYYAAISDLKNWDVTLLPSLYANFYKIGTITPLLKRDAKGRRIFILRAGLWNPKVASFVEELGCMWMMTQIAAKYVDTQRDGYVTIWDYTDFGMQHALATNHMKFIAMAKWTQNGVAGRIKEYHAINYPRVINVLWSMIKPFLKEKLKSRVHFHGSVESLLNHLPANSLPTYLGGTEDPDGCVDRAFLDEMVQQDEYFQDMMNNKFPTK